SVGESCVISAQGLLVVGPVWLNVTLRLIVAGQGANLGKLWLECVNKQANSNECSENEQPNGFNVAGVVAEVESQQRQYGHPAGDLSTGARGAAPAEASGTDLTRAHAVVYRWRPVVSTHVLSLVLSNPQFS